MDYLPPEHSTQNCILPLSWELSRTIEIPNRSNLGFVIGEFSALSFNEKNDVLHALSDTSPGYILDIKNFTKTINHTFRVSNDQLSKIRPILHPSISVSNIIDAEGLAIIGETAFLVTEKVISSRSTPSIPKRKPAILSLGLSTGTILKEQNLTNNFDSGVSSLSLLDKNKLIVASESFINSTKSEFIPSQHFTHSYFSIYNSRLDLHSIGSLKVLGNLRELHRSLNKKFLYGLSETYDSKYLLVYSPTQILNTNISTKPIYPVAVYSLPFPFSSKISLQGITSISSSSSRYEQLVIVNDNNYTSKTNFFTSSIERLITTENSLLNSFLSYFKDFIGSIILLIRRPQDTNLFIYKGIYSTNCITK